MSGDADLDRIMAKKMEKMQSAAGRQPAKDTPRHTLVSHLGHRGEEVLQCAEKQFPQQTAVLVARLAKLIQSRQLERLDGGQLLYVLGLAGIHIRMPTNIRVERDGRMVSLSEKIRGGE